MSVVIDVKANEKDALRSLRNVEKSIKRLDERIDETVTTTGRLIQGFAAFAAGGMVYNAVSKVADNIRTLEANVSMVSSSVDDMVLAMDKLRKISRETGANVAELGDLYRKIKQSMPNAESQRLLKITESIAKAMAGASDFIGAQLAIRQLTQALAKGQFNGDEFRSVAEQLPIIVQAMEQYLGVTRAEIFKMKEKGLLTPDLILKSIEYYQPYIERRFQSFSNNIAVQTNRVKNNIGLMFGAFLHSSGIYDLIVYDLRTTADIIGKLIQPLELVGAVIRVISGTIWEGVKYIAKAASSLAVTLAFIGKFTAEGVARGIIDRLKAFGALVDKAKLALFDLVDGVETQFGTMLTIATGIWSSLWDTVAEFKPWDYVRGALVSFKDKVIHIFWYIYDVLVGHSIWPDTIKAVGEWAWRAWDYVKGGFVHLRDKTIEMFVGIYNTVTSTVASMWARVSSVFRNNFNNWISTLDEGTAEKVLKAIKSISNLFVSFGRSILSVSNLIKNKTKDTIDYVVDVVLNAQFTKAVVDFASSLYDKIIAVLASAGRTAADITSPIVDFFKALFSKNTGIAIAAASGLIYALYGAIGILSNNAALMFSLRKLFLSSIAMASIQGLIYADLFPEFMGAIVWVAAKLGKTFAEIFAISVTNGINDVSRQIGDRVSRSLGPVFGNVAKDFSKIFITVLTSMFLGKKISKLFGGVGIAGAIGNMSPMAAFAGAGAGQLLGMSPAASLIPAMLMGTFFGKDPIVSEFMKKEREKQIRNEYLMYQKARFGDPKARSKFVSAHGRPPIPAYDDFAFASYGVLRVLPAVDSIASRVRVLLKRAIKPRNIALTIIGSIALGLMQGQSISEMADKFGRFITMSFNATKGLLSGNLKDYSDWIMSTLFMSFMMAPDLFIAAISKNFFQIGRLMMMGILTGILTVTIMDKVAKFLKEQFGIDNIIVSTGLSVVLAAVGAQMAKQIGVGFVSGLNKHVVAPFTGVIKSQLGKAAQASSAVSGQVAQGRGSGGIAGAFLYGAKNYGSKLSAFGSRGVGALSGYVIGDSIVGGLRSNVEEGSAADKTLMVAQSAVKYAAVGSMFGPMGTAIGGAVGALEGLAKAIGIVDENFSLLKEALDLVVGVSRLVWKELSTLYDKVRPVIDVFRDSFKLLTGGVKDFDELSDSFKAVSKVIIDVFNDLNDAAQGVVDGFNEIVGKLSNLIPDPTGGKPYVVKGGTTVFRSWQDITKENLKKSQEEAKRNSSGGWLSWLMGHADGGYITGPGGPKDDKIPALLSNGEFVINAEATKRWLPVLQAINNGSIRKFAEGGAVYYDRVMRDAGYSPGSLESRVRIAYNQGGFLSALSEVKKWMFSTKENTEAVDKNTEATKENTKESKESNKVAKKHSRFYMSEKGRKKSGMDYTNSFAGEFSSGLSDLLKSRISMGDFLTGLLDSFTSKIIDSFVEGFTSTLFDKFGGVFDKLFSNMIGTGSTVAGKALGGLSFGSGGGLLGGLFGSIGNIFTGLFSGIGDILGKLFLPGLFSFGLAGGGYVTGPGTQTSDSIPARLSNGEFVVNAGATSRWRPFLEAINTGRDPFTVGFAHGGFAGASPKARGGGQVVVNLNITGDISRQTKREIMSSIPEIAQAIDAHKRESGL